VPNVLPYRLAAVDLDDTLLGPDKEISAANAAAVRRLLEDGVTVMLASGRRHENMRRFHRQLDLPHGWIVSCNGAQVKNDVSGEVLHRLTVPADLATEIMEEGGRRGVTQNFYHPDGSLYVNASTEWTALYASRTKNDPERLEDFLALLRGQSPLKIIWVIDPKDAAAALPEMQARFGDRLYITITDPEYLEFMAPGVNKATGIAVAAARLGIPKEQVVTFGDGNNDVEMLEWAGLGVSMDHARESAKRAADRVTPPGSPETGFARAVEMLFAEAA